LGPQLDSLNDRLAEDGDIPRRDPPTPAGLQVNRRSLFLGLVVPLPNSA